MFEFFQDTEHLYTLWIYGMIIHDDYLWQLRWFLARSNTKKSETLKLFKQKIRYWKPDTCPCRLCKTCIKGVGYLWSNGISFWFCFEEILISNYKGVFFSFLSLLIYSSWLVLAYSARKVVNEKQIWNK